MATFPTPSLFPIVPHHRDNAPPASLPPKLAAGLAGIARLAADSPCADAKRGTEYFLLPVRSIVNRCESTRVPFPFTVNPYRGCEFGCLYCYARYTHEFMELDGGDFERKIYAKANAGPIASRDLAEMRIGGGHIAIGSATDPFQPAEREFGVTRAILERMAEREGLNLSITTKSDQVVREIDLLKRIAERSSLTINVTIVTVGTRLARMLEPRAPRPDLRLKALRQLRDAGLAAGVFMMPVLPGLTDSEPHFEAMARAASEARAQWFLSSPLWLMPSAAKHFLPFIEKKFPRLAKQYGEWYKREAYPPETYRQEISQRAAAMRKKYGLGARPVQSVCELPSPQLSLSLGAA
ncbi:MAG TPA: radical SAM protein [Candidatus Acidoferrales bacterium]|nr:radical SAM protein [Candidatus Acidoferrales bacterium]